MNALNQIIIKEIAAQGPITLAQYMTTCLMHPTHGYYTQKPVFGTAGDFITAPEISQMFGEMVGLALAQTWLTNGCPNPFHLVELGPGRGTLMADIIRATRTVAGFHQAMQISLYEASPLLREQQKLALSGIDAQWIDSLDQLSDAPLYLIANEFFDALPIRQFQRQGDNWHERMVGLSGDRLTLGLAKNPTLLDPLIARLGDTQDGEIVEICPQAGNFAQQIGHHIETHGGLGLIIDYGDWRSIGDTFQAVQNHAYTDPFVSPGCADLTAHVDFEALANVTPSAFTQLTSQGVWLERLGITHRAQSLASQLTGAPLERHIAAHKRLTHPDEMGTLFKVLGFFQTNTPIPVGFDA